MKKKVLCAFICLCLTLAILPMAAFAASGLTIAGNAIDDTGYYQMTSATTVSEKLDTAPNSNYFHWDNNTRTLTLYGVTVGGNGIRFSGLRNLTIVLAEGSVNTVTTDTGSAVVHENGNMIISGKGALNATGQSNGSWVMDDLTIKEGATVNLVGKTGAGFMTQYRFCELIIEAGCNATFTGATYGFCSQNGSSIITTIKNANVTASGGTAATQSAPTLEGVSATASVNQDGSDPVAYVASNNADYKWFSAKAGSTPTTTTKPTTVPTTVSTTVSTTLKPTAVSTVTTSVSTTTVSTTAPTITTTAPVSDPTTEPTTAPVTDSSTESTAASTSTTSTAASTTLPTSAATNAPTAAPTTDSDAPESQPDNMLWLWIVLGVAGLGIVAVVIVLMKKKTAK